jgi:hypothetical protein
VTSLKNIGGSVAALGLIFTGFLSVETRYAKADDLEKLLRSQEQKIVWDLEENVETSESLSDKRKWFDRLKEKVDEFCDEYPDEDECDRDYLDDVEASIDEEN